MGKRDDLIARYADDLKNKCGMVPDMDLLTKVTIGCGPSIYDADSNTVAASQPGELETVKKNFLIKKLGLPDGPELDAAIARVVETYGASERNKYRAVVYYDADETFRQRVGLRLSPAQVPAIQDKCPGHGRCPGEEFALNQKTETRTVGTF